MLFFSTRLLLCMFGRFHSTVPVCCARFNTQETRRDTVLYIKQIYSSEEHLHIKLENIFSRKITLFTPFLICIIKGNFFPKSPKIILGIKSQTTIWDLARSNEKHYGTERYKEIAMNVCERKAVVRMELEGWENVMLHKPNANVFCY